MKQIYQQGRFVLCHTTSVFVVAKLMLKVIEALCLRQFFYVYVYMIVLTIRT